MLRDVAIIVATLSFASGNALAADLPAKAAPLIPAGYNWTGFYAGVGAGYQTGQATGTAVTGVNIEPNLWYVGITAGYRYQLPDNIVFGFDISAPIWASTNTFAPGGGTTARLDPYFAVAPEFQLGYAIGRWLPFVGLGVGFTDIKATITPVGAPAVSDTELSPAILVTFGLFYAVTDNVIAGLRYDHIDLAQHNYTFGTAGAPTIMQAGGNTDGVTAVLEYKF